LFDRADEIETFRQTLGDARQCAYFIYGPPGTGKTRLAEECTELARDEGWHIMRAVASEVAQAVPLGAIGHLLPAQSDPADPVALFTKATQWFTADSERVIVFIDDMHLLDPASAMLIGGLLNAGLVFLVGTIRSDAVTHDLIASIGHGDQCQRVDLTGLSPRQVDSLLRLVLGGVVDAGAGLRLHQASGGVLLFLRELVAGALSSGTLVGDGGVWRLLGRPAGTPKLAEVIARRLAGVPDGDRAVLEAVAVCGPLAASGLDSAALSRLEGSGLIELRVSERRTEAAIAHPLYAETIRAGMPLLRRRQVLAQEADRLLATGMRRREDRFRQAIHLLEATGTADPALLHDAAQLARYASDFGSVARLALALIRLDPGAGPRMMLGEALYELGRFTEADDALRDAAAAAAGDHEYLMATVLRTQSLAFAALHVKEAMAVNEIARQKLASQFAQDALRVDQVALLCFSGETAQTAPLLGGLRDIADARTRVMGAIPHAHVLIEAGRIAAAITVAEAAHAEHLAMPGVIATAHASLHRGAHMLALVEAGRIADARVLGERAYAHAITDHALIAQMWLAIELGKLEYVAGRMATAKAWFATAAAIAADHHFRGAQWLASAGQALAAAGLADAPGAQAACQRLAELSPADHRRADVAAADCWATAVTGNLSAAREMMADAVRMARATGSHTTEAQLLCDLARLGDPGGVRERLNQLTALTDSTFTSARAAYAAALADLDPGALERAAERFERIGALLLAAEAFSTAAECHRRAGDIRSARSATARAGRLAAQCEGGRSPALSLPAATHGLTPREREIATQAIQGHSSREIADQLVVSPRTVECHLQHIYQKMGVNRREDLRKALEVAEPVGVRERLLVRDNRADPVPEAGIAPGQHEGVDDRHDHDAERHVREPVVGVGLPRLAQVVDRDADGHHAKHRQRQVLEHAELGGPVPAVVERQREVGQEVHHQDQDRAHGGRLAVEVQRVQAVA
jgi:DNA-binding CsgD family transcriptional regulator